MTNKIEKPDNRLILLLAVFVFFAGVLGYFQIRGSIYAPFLKDSDEYKAKQAQEEISDLIAQDTDKDGITDFDERFVYLTSAYISDSDGDGFSDKEEIDAQSNPLDPKSTPYSRNIEIESKAGDEILASKNEEGLFLEKIFPAPSFDLEEESLSQEEISAEEIRDLLIKAGLDKEIVDKLDDKTLINLYNETKQETGIDLENLQAPKE